MYLFFRVRKGVRAEHAGQNHYRPDQMIDVNRLAEPKITDEDRDQRREIQENGQPSRGQSVQSETGEQRLNSVPGCPNEAPEQKSFRRVYSLLTISQFKSNRSRYFRNRLASFAEFFFVREC